MPAPGSSYIFRRKECADIEGICQQVLTMFSIHFSIILIEPYFCNADKHNYVCNTDWTYWTEKRQFLGHFPMISVKGGFKESLIERMKGSFLMSFIGSLKIINAQIIAIVLGYNSVIQVKRFLVVLVRWSVAHHLHAHKLLHRPNQAKSHISQIYWNSSPSLLQCFDTGNKLRELPFPHLYFCINVLLMKLTRDHQLIVTRSYVRWPVWGRAWVSGFNEVWKTEGILFD